MKQICALLLLLCIATPAFAVEADAPETTETRWQAMSPAERGMLIDAWMALDETTRPPFPIFRDAELEKQCARKHHKAPKPAANGNKKPQAQVDSPSRAAHI